MKTITKQLQLSDKRIIPQLKDCQEHPHFSLLNLLDEIRYHHKIFSVNDERFIIHKARSLACSDHRFFVMSSCNGVHRYWQPLPCGSFFDEVCNLFISNRLKSQIQKNIADVPHIYVTFTIPKEIRKFLKFHKVTWKWKNDRIKVKYDFDRLYDCVRKTLQIYFKKFCREKPVSYAALVRPHTYGSLDMKWKPHLNVEIPTTAFCEGEEISLTFLDYTKIKEIYKQQLEKEFNITMNCLPQVEFKPPHPPEAVVNNATRYFRDSPMKSSYITRVTETDVHYMTHERYKRKLPPLKVTHLQFWYLITQHVPPNFYRMTRYWGFYSPTHKDHDKFISHSENENVKRFYLFDLIEKSKGLCPKCYDHVTVDLVCINGRVFISKESSIDLNIKASDDNHLYLEDCPQWVKPPPDSYEVDHKGVMDLETHEINRPQVFKTKNKNIKSQIESLKLNDLKPKSSNYKGVSPNYDLNGKKVLDEGYTSKPDDRLHLMEVC